MVVERRSRHAGRSAERVGKRRTVEHAAWRLRSAAVPATLSALVRSAWLVVCLLVVAPALAVAQVEAPAGAVDPDVERTLGRGYQRELPGLEDAPEGRARQRLDGDPRRELERRESLRRQFDERSRRWTDPDDRDDRGGAIGGPLSGLASMLLWGLVVVAALLVGLTMYRQLTSYAGEEAPTPTSRPATDAQLAAVIERPRDDADELASQGRFADAIHTLLLRTLHELASQKLVRVTPSMTSREILGKVALLGDAREALQGLIVAVEQTWFGDDVPQVEDYQRCRAEFDRFAAAYRKGAGGRA